LNVVKISAKEKRTPESSKIAKQHHGAGDGDQNDKTPSDDDSVKHKQSLLFHVATHYKLPLAIIRHSWMRNNSNY
jgi:hypothetical protein